MAVPTQEICKIVTLTCAITPITIMTRKDIAFKVVKIVATGMDAIWIGLAINIIMTSMATANKVVVRMISIVTGITMY